jgi:putative ABC transport system substrate-binding protein
VQLETVKATEESAFEAAFAKLAEERVGALIVGSHTLFFNNYDRLIALAARYRIPTMYQSREATAAGGLIAYGTDLPAVYHELGIYAGRILRGEKPADLPVQQVTKMQLAINMKTAKALGLTIPPMLLASVDEVIE